MTHDQAFVPLLLSRAGTPTQSDSIFDHAFARALPNILVVGFGVLLLSSLAQITIPLPWTPVPITGQTFGVALISLTWGRKRGLAVLLAYLILGAISAPIFAQGRSGLTLAPSVGYLFGMLAASYVMGSLADRGWTRSFTRAWLATVSGSVITFSFGVIGLSFFLPSNELFAAGVLPFLPGDFVKTLLACTIAHHTRQTLKDESGH